MCYECVFVSLRIQNAMCLRHIGIGGQTGSAVFFNIIPHTIRFEITFTEYKMCVLPFSTSFLSETFLTVRRMEPDKIKNLHRKKYKVPLFCEILI